MADSVSSVMPPIGLTEAEVQRRRAQGQANVPPPPTSRTYRQIAKENVFTTINIVIFTLGVALALVGRMGDAVISLLVISSNIVVGLLQEVRAKRKLDEITLLTRPTATVVRVGQELNVPQEELVLGDVLKLTPGDQVMLDGEVLQSRSLTVDESPLTGESDPIPKPPGAAVFSGSYCVAGNGYYRATKVGKESLSGQIVASAKEFRRTLTPLQSQIERIVKVLLVCVIYLEFLLLLNAVLNRLGAPDVIANATLVVGLVPNGLFLSMSVAYAVGAVRMLKYGTLVQQANAVESLSNVDVLCMDKTGTLTTNRLQVHAVYPAGVTENELRRILGRMAASATAGNRTTAAIAAAFPTSRETPVAEVPFSSARKWSAVTLAEGGVYALGAPEMLRPHLAASANDRTDWEQLQAQLAAWVQQGLRVLLVAHHPEASTLHDGDGVGGAAGDDGGRNESRLPDGMATLGLVALRDELRPEAGQAIHAFRTAGVQVKLISGDNPETVAALARQAGFGADLRLVSGLDLAEMKESEFSTAATNATVFGRITPQQKERIVHALRRAGRYVAMTGDGVNDVLALKEANLGIAMQSGSQATRNAAALVLMEDSFAALVPAVREGQRIVNGMTDIVNLYLTRVLTMALLIVSSLVIGEFPLALRHGSIVTLFAVGIPATLLAVWAQPGVRREGSLLRSIVHFSMPPVLVTSALGVLLFYGVWLVPVLREIAAESPSAQVAATLAAARPVAQTALAVFVALTGLLLVIFVEPPTPWWTGGDTLSTDKRPALLAIVLVVGLIVVTRVPILSHIFALAPLSLVEYGLIFGAATVWLLTVRFLWRRGVLDRFIGLQEVQNRI